MHMYKVRYCIQFGPHKLSLEFMPSLQRSEANKHTSTVSVGLAKACPNKLNKYREFFSQLGGVCTCISGAFW